MTAVGVAVGALLTALVLFLLWWVFRPEPGPRQRRASAVTPRQLYVQRLRATGDRHHAEFADILAAEPEQPGETGAELAERYRRYADMKTIEFQRPTE